MKIAASTNELLDFGKNRKTTRMTTAKGRMAIPYQRLRMVFICL